MHLECRHVFDHSQWTGRLLRLQTLLRTGLPAWSDLAMVTIKIKALKLVYWEDAFKPPAFHTVLGLRLSKRIPTGPDRRYSRVTRGTITITMVPLASDKMQQAITWLGEELVANVILIIKELDRPALTHLSHTMWLVVSSYNTLSENRRKETVSKSWVNKN